MALPTSYIAGLILLLFSMVFWGSWLSMFKAAGKWRYEFFYLDFSVGFLLAGVIAAFTFGSINSKELTFQDAFLLTASRNLIAAVAAGVVLNLAMLLTVASSVATGMAVSFPIVFGIGTSISLIWNFALDPRGTIWMLFTGIVLLVISVVMAAYGASIHGSAVASAPKPAFTPDPRTRGGKKAAAKAQGAGALMAILLAVVAGLFFGCLDQVLGFAGPESDTGTGPYGSVLLMGVGILISSIGLSPFYFAFPVQGEPAVFVEFFRSGIKQHLMGLTGGVLLALALLFGFLGSRVAPLGTATIYFLSHAGPLVAIVLGLAVWKEFQQPDSRAKGVLWGGLAMMAAGLACIALFRSTR
jgi:glucose uptake protein